jgi:ABC-type Fe3+/spermidine/putrescine transport system ATPase subunit
MKQFPSPLTAGPDDPAAAFPAPDRAPWEPEISAAHAGPVVTLTDVRVGPESGAVPLADITLALRAPEILVLLGGAGSGVATALWCVSGDVRPTAGHVVVAGEDVTDVPARRRAVALVDPDGLDGQRTIARTLELGRRAKRLPGEQRDALLADIAALLGLGEHTDRTVAELSPLGRLRVALGRALAEYPVALAVVEPFAGLDHLEREAARRDLRAVRAHFGLPILVASVDPTVALSLADRVVVLVSGRIVQDCGPATLDARPATERVAALLGPPNVVRGAAARAATGSDRRFRVRPSALRLLPEFAALAADERGLDGTVRDVVFLGDVTRISVAVDAGGTLVAQVQDPDIDVEALDGLLGTPVRVAWQVVHETPIG